MRSRGSGPTSVTGSIRRHRRFGGLECHRRVEVPVAELLLDLISRPTCFGESRSQAHGSMADLLGLGKALFCLPLTVASLQ